MRDDKVVFIAYISQGFEGIHMATKAHADSTSEIDVRGFHLIALCHRFGRRGRLFASSLARQTDNPYEIHLTVLYSDELDAELIREGLNCGSRITGTTFRQLPENEIMRRAVHYSQCGTNHRCSHTVFVDIDLWFPPWFWGQYGRALAKEQPGYWSCEVINVCLDNASEIVDIWSSADYYLFRRLSTTVRHDGWKGKVGHFQCIPQNFVQYPPDPILAVNRADETFATYAVAASPDARDERRIGTTPAFHLDHPSCWTGSLTQL